MCGTAPQLLTGVQQTLQGTFNTSGLYQSDLQEDYLLRSAELCDCAIQHVQVVEEIDGC